MSSDHGFRTLTPSDSQDIEDVLRTKCSIPVLRKFEQLLNARKSVPNTFDASFNWLIRRASVPFELKEFIERYMHSREQSRLQTADVCNLRMIIKHLIAKIPKDTTEVLPPFSINGNAEAHLYNNPTLDDDEQHAQNKYKKLLTQYKDPRTIKKITRTLVYLGISSRVRSYTALLNATKLATSRHAPVMRPFHDHSCPCDKKNTHATVVSGCSRCCVNVPVDKCICRCAPPYTRWTAYEVEDMTCNHVGSFDSYKFAMMFFEGKICTICSTYTDGYCQHREYALDAEKLYLCGVEEHADIEYVKRRVEQFKSFEALFHREVMRSNAKVARHGDKNGDNRTPKRKCIEQT
jgi:hypothetical protein